MNTKGLYTQLYTREGILDAFASDGAVKELPLPLTARKQVRYTGKPDPESVEERIAKSDAEET